MGALFRLICQYTGLSQMRIATAVGLGQGRISEVINGIRKIRDAKVFERTADGLDMPDHARILLGLSPRQITSRTPPRGSAAASSGQDAELLRQITAALSIDSTVVRVIQGETDNIRLLDRRLGASAVAGKLEAHISHIETGLRYSLRPGNREQVAHALADASALAGWQAIDIHPRIRLLTPSWHPVFGAGQGMGQDLAKLPVDTAAVLAVARCVPIGVTRSDPR